MTRVRGTLHAAVVVALPTTRRPDPTPVVCERPQPSGTPPRIADVGDGVGERRHAAARGPQLDHRVEPSPSHLADEERLARHGRRHVPFEHHRIDGEHLGRTLGLNEWNRRGWGNRIDARRQRGRRDRRKRRRRDRTGRTGRCRRGALGRWRHCVGRRGSRVGRDCRRSWSGRRRRPIPSRRWRRRRRSRRRPAGTPTGRSHTTRAGAGGATRGRVRRRSGWGRAATIRRRRRGRGGSVRRRSLTLSEGQGQARTRTRQVLLDRSGAHAERLGDLAFGLAGVEAQHDALLLASRERSGSPLARDGCRSSAHVDSSESIVGSRSRWSLSRAVRRRRSRLRARLSTVTVR